MIKGLRDSALVLRQGFGFRDVFGVWGPGTSFLLLDLGFRRGLWVQGLRMRGAVTCSITLATQVVLGEAAAPPPT